MEEPGNRKKRIKIKLLIYYIIYNEYGAEYATKLINCTQRFINLWLTYHGFSIGVKDIVPNNKTQEENN